MLWIVHFRSAPVHVSHTFVISVIMINCADFNRPMKKRNVKDQRYLKLKYSMLCIRCSLTQSQKPRFSLLPSSHVCISQLYDQYFVKCNKSMSLLVDVRLKNLYF